MKKKGFSLVELLVVVAIIGILATIMIPNVKEHMRKAKVTRTKGLIESLSMIVSTYKNDFGVYPPSYDPQKFYKAIMGGKTTYSPKAEDIRMIRKNESFWVKDDKVEKDQRREQVLTQAGVLPIYLKPQEDEYVFIDSWDNPLYFISSDEYNPSGKSVISGQSNSTKTLPCAYQIRKDSASKTTRVPYNMKTFQLCSFGPDEATYPDITGVGGGIFSMIDTDKVDNDGDGKIDKEDRPTRININSTKPEFVGEDDITNFQ